MRRLPLDIMILGKHNVLQTMAGRELAVARGHTIAARLEVRVSWEDVGVEDGVGYEAEVGG